MFFGELKEIKAVIRQKAQSDKGTQAQRGKARSNNEDGRGKKRNTLHDSRTTKRGRRMKFRPEITRVKLNPEQAVLTCNCYGEGWKTDFSGPRFIHFGTGPENRWHNTCNYDHYRPDVKSSFHLWGHYEHVASYYNRFSESSASS